MDDRDDRDDRHAWERPGAHEAAPGVYRIPLPLPGDHLHAVNVYAIADGDEVVMIDGGWAMANATDLLASSLDTIGYGLHQVREYLVTHLHRDHYTQAVAMRAVHGTPVAVGEGEKACLRVVQSFVDDPELARSTTHPTYLQLVAAGAPDLAALVIGPRDEQVDVTHWQDPDRWLADGIDIPLATRTLRVVHTPGHTAGHVVFHDPGAQALFAGDHVLPHITPSVGFELAPVPSPLGDYLASLRLVRAMPDATLLPAHGPVTGSTHARVDELLDHHEQRLTETADAVAAGAATGHEVARRLTWTRRHRTFDELDVFNRMMAVQETMAHLTVLVERGWLRRSVREGVVEFARA